VSLRLDLPILQAPMAGVSTPALAAAVSNVGALGAISVGATDAESARAMIAAVRQATARPFNVNVFVHAPAIPDPAREAAWLAGLALLVRREYFRPQTERLVGSFFAALGWHMTVRWSAN